MSIFYAVQYELFPDSGLWYNNLYSSIPVGRPRVYFNAHRIHPPEQVVDCFDGLYLVEFSGIDDHDKFRQKILPNELAESTYACGLFLLTRDP